MCSSCALFPLLMLPAWTLIQFVSHVCWHFLVFGQLSVCHFLFVCVDTLGASLVPPFFPFYIHFLTLYHHQYMLVCLLSLHPHPIFQQVMGPAAAWYPQHQLFKPLRDCHSLFWPLFWIGELLGVPRIFRPLSSNSKTLHTFLYHLTTSCHLSHGCSTPRNFFSSSKNPQKSHTHSLIAPHHLAACCSSCSPFVPLSPLAAHLMDLLHCGFLLFSLFSYAVFARYPLVCHFHTVHCWFHSSSPVSSRFLLVAYSFCWFHSSSLFSYDSSPILPWFAICVWFITGFTPVRWFHPSSCCLCAAPRWFHPGSCHLHMVLFALFMSLPILQCIYSLIMTLKLDHIPTLDSAADYPSWSKLIMCTLQGKGFWGFIEGSEDPLSPFPIVPATAPALKAHCEWWQKDAKIKDIIKHCISPVISTIIPCTETTTTCDIWATLKTLYGHVDIVAQFDLCAHISDVKLENFTGLDKYIGKFKTAHLCFITMGVTFQEGEMVRLLIRNLLMDGVWPNFKQLLTQCAQDHLDHSANLDPPPPPDTLLNIVITHISIECNHLESSYLETHCHLLASMPIYQQSAFVSTPTNIHKHAKNPLGVCCSNCHLTSHDRDHYFSWGGGMDGQGPDQLPSTPVVCRGLISAPQISAGFWRNGNWQRALPILPFLLILIPVESWHSRIDTGMFPGIHRNGMQPE